MIYVLKGELDTCPTKRMFQLSEFFVLVLTGVAFDATIEPVGASLETTSDLVRTIFLFGSFVLLAFRFLIGNFTHLNDDELQRKPAYVLLYDMSFIGLESVILIFVGRFSALGPNRFADCGKWSVNYLTLSLLVLLVDVVWLGSLYCLGELRPYPWKRRRYHLDWLRINVIQAGGGLFIYVFDRAYILRPWFLGLIFLVNICAFIRDVVLTPEIPVTIPPSDSAGFWQYPNESSPLGNRKRAISPQGEDQH